MRSSASFFRVVSLAALSVAAVLVLSRCGLEEATAPSGTFRSVYQAIESSNCVECHTASGAAFVDGVTLEFATAAAAYSGLTTKTVTGAVGIGDCGGINIVTPNSLSQSYLAAVLFEDVHQDNFAGVTGCTPITTHHAFVNLSSAQITSIKAWINNGAPND